MNQTYDDAGHEKSLSVGLPIILYLHGISGSRYNTHRLELYRVLQSLDFHVLAVDYRGYADSSDVILSEQGVATDAKAVFSYIKTHSNRSKIIIWGHSLGTG